MERDSLRNYHWGARNAGALESWAFDSLAVWRGIFRITLSEAKEPRGTQKHLYGALAAGANQNTEN